MGLKQLEPTIVTIGDVKFYICPFPAMKAANISGELTTLLSPLLGALTPILDKIDDSEADSDNGKSFLDENAGEVLGSVMTNVSVKGDDVERLMKKLLLGGHISVEYEGDDGNTVGEKLTADLLNELFCGNVQDMYVLCWHVIKTNFGGFFKKLSALSGKAGLAGEKVMRKIL